MPYVYSTLSSSVAYETEVGQITIQGSANVSGANFITPRGVVTSVSDEQAAALKKNHVFQLHEQNGYVTVERAKADADEVASNMTGRDNSAPDTAETLTLTDEEVEKVEGTKVLRKQK